MGKIKRIDIKSSDDLILVMEDVFNEFVEPLFTSDKHTHPVPDDSWIWEEEGITRLYYESTANLLDRYIERLKKLFHKYYPDCDFNFYSSYYRKL